MQETPSLLPLRPPPCPLRHHAGRRAMRCSVAAADSQAAGRPAPRAARRQRTAAAAACRGSGSVACRSLPPLTSCSKTHAVGPAGPPAPEVPTAAA
eukprot:360156-Chlamydomonas_euryale.AAC.1